MITRWRNVIDGSFGSFGSFGSSFSEELRSKITLGILLRGVMTKSYQVPNRLPFTTAQEQGFFHGKVHTTKEKK